MMTIYMNNFLRDARYCSKHDFANSLFNPMSQLLFSHYVDVEKCSAGLLQLHYYQLVESGFKPWSIENKWLDGLPSFSLLSFFKLYFIDYTIRVVLIFPSLPPSTQQPPLPQAIPSPLFMSMGHVCKLFGYFISYTQSYIPMAIL